MEEETSSDATVDLEVENSPEDGLLVLPCRTNLPNPFDAGEHLWVLASEGGRSVRIATLLEEDEQDKNSSPPIMRQVHLERQSVLDLMVQLGDWLLDRTDDTEEEEEEGEAKECCSNTSTSDSSPDTASPSESNASSYESTEEMVTRIVHSCIQEALSDSLNSSGRANRCDRSNACGNCG